jgi:hypothetical protein
MGQGPDRRNVRQSERDFILELLFGILKDADGAAVLVYYLRELVFCGSDRLGQGFDPLLVGFYLGLSFCA